MLGEEDVSVLFCGFLGNGHAECVGEGGVGV